jgi:imidazolonepropionase
MHADNVWHNARLATLTGPGLGIVEHGTIAANNGRIVYAGASADAPHFDATDIADCEGRWITPGLVDCHTHLVHAGDRAREFQMRLEGASYEDIAKAGGGIVSTVEATRAASEEDLIASALPRLDALIGEGLCSIEIKSGYGLSLADELKMLRVARALAERRNVRVTTTFLGAHALPPDAGGDKDKYIDLVCNEMLPVIARENLADAVDAFCENIAFTPQQTARVFDAAQKYGLKIKLHADQLSNGGGAALAARYSALSADHLEHTGEAGIAAMARAGTAAVLLPGAFYFLRETKLPPLDLIRKHDVPIAIATDNNPGTSPLTSLLLAMNMAATCFRMTVDECIAGVTREGARAAGLLNQTGTLETGKHCDLAIWNIDQLAELVYRIGYNPLHERIWNGQ